MTDFDLASVDLFANLDPGDLAQLEVSLSHHEVPAGENLFCEGDEGDSAYVITTGEIEVLKESAGRDVRLAVLGPGALIGEMALLARAPRNATCRALTDAALVSIPRDTFNGLLTASPTAMRAIFDGFITRGREQESRLRQAERMAQLGVLTAGLAHEMNNPAAAIVRGSDQLSQRVAAYGSLMQSVPTDAVLPEPSARERIMSSIETADAEDELETSLTSAGIADAWQLAPALVAAGFTVDDLDGHDWAFTQESVRAIANRAEIESLLGEITEGAQRLADLVGALKSYSFLDQAPVQDVDITKGIEDTLLILKSKTSDIDIERRYEPGLPRITAYGSQLNQVWTNLIDNAADAIHEADLSSGRITIEASFVDGCIVVSIANNGPAIPPEVQDRIFEAFFTTKAPGHGTGLGLDTAYRIVVTQHGGTLKLDSDDEGTRFTVVLPASSETPVD
ncbi:MAG: ATP-binding protein [Actinomycetota bacterium]